MKNKKMPRLTIARARELVKRELGISASSLTAPSDLNDNPNFPWYVMNTGTKCVQVHTTGNNGGKQPNEIVVLTIVHKNSSECTNEYFYADTLEFTAEYTESKNWHDICEMVGDNDMDVVSRRLLRKAGEAWQQHLSKALQND